MKGTLFSSDFAVDGSDNLRLLEINTDTGFTSASFQHFDFTPLYNTWNSHSIAELHVIYKDHQLEFVNHLSSSIESEYTGSISFNYHIEESNTIYPYTIADADDKFILRLAYDENAVFDSTYCKDRINVLKLFNENTASLSVPELYVSSSDGIINTLTSSLNNNIQTPDVVTKAFSHTTNPMDFLKFDRAGYYHSSSIEMITDYVDNYLDKDNLYAEKYHLSPTTLSDGVVKSIRAFSVVYGSNLDVVQLGAYKIESMFDLPQSITGSSEGLYGYNDGITYQIPLKHYYEYTTNFIKPNTLDGLLDVESYKSVDDTFISITDARVSGSIKSYFVSGSPDTDNRESYMSWSYSGNTLSDSFVTESVIYTVVSESFNYPGVVEINLSDNDGFYCGTEKVFLTYNTSSNEFRYKSAHELTASVDFLTNESGSVVPISSSNYAILDDHTSSSLVRIDVEDTDTYFVSSSESIVTHNFHYGWRHPGTCFAAGTQIEMKDGTFKNIEDVVVGDEVLGWDGEDIGIGTVSAIDHRHTVGSHADACKSLGDEPSLYTLIGVENEWGIEFTPEHPFLTKEGWKSLVPDPNQEPYATQQEPKVLKVGDFVNCGGPNDWEEIKEVKVVRSNPEESVYNITVDGLHSYIANGLVVHNK